DLDRLTGPGIAPHPRRPVPFLENAEPADVHLVALGDRVLDLGHQRVHGDARRLRVTQASGHALDELALVHGSPPFLCRPVRRWDRRDRYCTRLAPVSARTEPDQGV